MIVKGLNIPSIEKITKCMIKNDLTIKSVSNFKVLLETEDGWTKEDFWGIDKYKDYLSAPEFYKGRVSKIEINVISDDPNKVGKTISI